MKIQTAERASGRLEADNPVFQRHLVAYHEAARIIGGDVLEIGCGEGYGIPILAPNAKNYTAVDKYTASIDELPSNAKFIQMLVPELNAFDEASFDWVVSFQVIEHIRDDNRYLEEIYRVLKPGGKFVFTTPNKKMSLSRNPYHIREYTVSEMKAHVEKHFDALEHKGVFGAEKMMEYHNKNRESVARYTRWDIFNLQHNLPAWMLKIPYELANKMNRKSLSEENTGLVSEISTKDFYIDAANDQCLDHFCIAQKKENLKK